jgi:DNA invertase Pin-like site-specific DNA recombinase
MLDTTVDIYCRSATYSQEGDNTLDKQEAACRAHCLEYGLTIGMVIREVAAGSQYRYREGLAKLRARYMTGMTQGVVITTLDRLSRKTAHLIILMSEMEDHNIAFYTAKEVPVEAFSGSLIRLFVVSAAELEREKASANNPADSNLD